MHYAYPGRKSSHPPTYTARPNRSSIINSLRRIRTRTFAIAVSGIILFFYLASRLFGRSAPVTPAVFTKAPAGQPNVVVVTPINPGLDPSFNEAIIQNRQDYAAKHGYAYFFPKTTDYPIGDSPSSWAKVPAMRHAMTIFSHTPYFFFIDEHTLITNPNLKVEDHIMDKERLETLMIMDVPVVPPDSVIKTFSHLKGDKIDLVLTQDKEGLCQGAWIMRRGEWAKYLLDAWFDPLYRSYNFQKAERHALEHIVQWHGTLLAKIALVPQSIMNSYTKEDARVAGANGLWKEGDFMMNFNECESSKRSCEEEMRPWFNKLHAAAEKEG